MQETLAGVRTVRALGLQARSEAQFSALAAGAAEASLSAQRWEAAYEPAVGFTLSAATALTLGFGGWLVWQGQLTVGQLTSFSLYLGQLIWPMFAAGWVLSLVQRGKAAWGRLQPVLDTPLERRRPRHGSRASHRDRWSCRACASAIRGRSGPRSTVSRFSCSRAERWAWSGRPAPASPPCCGCCCATMHRQTGRLLWNGVELKDYTLDALRAAIAWVPQEAFLFSTPVAENIALARPGATREEIEQAARLAAVHEDILRLPHGYDTPVGERGVTLSGGQRQRVALARALLTDAPMLLLDDTLSAVDTDTEARILAHLRQQRAGRTTIIVSHRLSAVADADEIVVLRDGRVVEQGDHAALLAANGWYARQWRYQQLEASLDAS